MILFLHFCEIPHSSLSSLCVFQLHFFYLKDRKLTFDVCYSSASTTRQRLEVKTAACMATMSDFVFPHPDGLATYRVYEDIKKDSDSNDVADMHGEAIDIAVS